MPDICAGFLVLLFNLHGPLRYFAHHQALPGSITSKFLEAIAAIPKFLLPAGPASGEYLYRLMSWCFIGCDVAIVCMLLLAVRRKHGRYLWLPGLALLAGVFSVAILAWVGMLGYGLIWIVAALWRGVAWLLAVVGAWLAHLFPSLGILVGALVLIGLVIWLWKVYGYRGLLALGVGILLLFLSFPFGRWLYRVALLPLFEWMANLLQPLLHFLAIVFGWLGIAILWILRVVLLGIVFVGFCLFVAVLLIGHIGTLAIDQFKAAWACGESIRGAAIGFCSIGISISLILLVSLGTIEPEPGLAPTSQTVVGTAPSIQARKHGRFNRKGPAVPPPADQAVSSAVAIGKSIDRAWAASYFTFGISSPVGVMTKLLPSSVSKWTKETFRTASAPIFDAILLLAAIAVSFLGIARGLFQKEEKGPRVVFYNKDLVGLTVSVLFPIAILAAIAHLHSEN